MTKAEKKERQRINAELRNAPLHLLIAINNMCTQIQYGLDGGKVVEGVNIPALHLPKAQEKWCREQLAKIVRWDAACMERYGFDFHGRTTAGLWHSGQDKVNLISRAIQHYAPDCGYDELCIIQMIIAEIAWASCRVVQQDNSREARYLTQTMDTFTGKFFDEGDRVDWWATDVYMAIGPILNGSEPYRKLDFEHIPAWSESS